VFRSIRQTILEYLCGFENKAVLDLCCGTGNQLKLLASSGFNKLYGVDLSQPMLNVAGKNAHGINLYLEDAGETHFQDHEMDAIIISLALHEKNKSTQMALLSESKRLLKPGGRLIIADYQYDETSPALTKMIINFVEHIAGGEHFQNYLTYIQNGGLNGLLEDSPWFSIKSRKHIKGCLTITALACKK
nr:methyltransferase domain-containing protein [FCB group bacterium]